MSRFIKLLTVSILFSFLASSLTDACIDTYPDCANYKRNCGHETINKFCPVTCGVCPNDSCSQDNGGCGQLCLQIEDVVMCKCIPGFKLASDNKTCVDIDECNEGPNPCILPIGGVCINNVGSFSCQRHKCTEFGYMNYYRSSECCRLKNSTCGVTKTIRKRIDFYNKIVTRRGTTRRILFGNDAALTAWPWQAQVLFRGGAHCGATLISHRWLISAAHCFIDHSHNLMHVYLGQIRSATFQDLDRTRRQQRRITRVVLHDDYFDRYNNDVALIELDLAVEYNDIISPICLPCGEVPNVGDKCWITGFGKTKSGPEIPETLQEVDVPIVRHEDCAEAYSETYAINENSMICAGYPEGGKDACLGDSGGPLACQRNASCEWYLAGVTSFGRGCGLPGFYGVYANVINYEAWIRRKLGNELETCNSEPRKVCQDFVNNDDECYSKLDACDEFPFYMAAKCKLACCQASNGELPSAFCRDSDEIAPLCGKYSEFCKVPIFQNYMKENCRKTCNFC